jgi:hypothetical protein
VRGPGIVLSASPADGSVAVPVALEVATLTFDRDMQGETVEIQVGDAVRPASVTWDATGRVATIGLAGLLQQDRRTRIGLNGLSTAEGGPASGGSVLGDDSLDFVVGDRPTVVSSSPADDALEVYPAPTTSRIELGLVFSEPMDTSQTEATLITEDGSAMPVAMEWANDGKAATGQVQGNPALGGRVLLDDTAYELRFDRFRDAAGNPVAEPARVSFTTGTLDPLLNHSCGHVLYGPFGSVAATSDSADAPYADAGHVSYTVQLPPAGSAYRGYTGFRVATGKRFDLFLDAPVAITASADSWEASLETVITPAACDGITHRVTFTAEGDGEWRLLHEHTGASFNMIVEVTDAP